MAGSQGVPVSSVSSQASQPVGGGGRIQVSPAAMALATQVSEGAKFAFAQRRPLMEMLDKNSFAKPENFSDALSRVRKNVGYFKVNYGIFLLGVLALSLVTHPSALITLGVVVACWAYLYMVRRDPLVLWGRTFSEKEILVIMSVLTVLMLLLTDVLSLLIYAGLTGVALITAHGVFRVPDDLFLDDQVSSGGLLDMFGSGASQPQLASHV